MDRNEIKQALFDPNADVPEIYGKATKRMEWEDGLRQHIPLGMQGGMARWILFGVKPGSFLQRVICNDFMGAASRADEGNKVLLWSYAMFLYNYAPESCYGSEEVLTSWGGLYPEPAK